MNPSEVTSLSLSLQYKWTLISPPCFRVLSRTLEYTSVPTSTKFSSTMGRALNEFGYKEHPAITNRILLCSLTQCTYFVGRRFSVKQGRIVRRKPKFFVLREIHCSVLSCAGEDHTCANHDDILQLVQPSVTWHTQDSYIIDCPSIR